MTDLFNHTLQAIASLDHKLQDINSTLMNTQVQSSGVSFASSSGDSSDDLAPNANLASISFSKPSTSLKPPSKKYKPVTSSIRESSELSVVNNTMLTILDKLVESKSAKSPTNLSFPTFSGQKDSMPFQRWITLVCGILSTTEWNKLYDSKTNTYVESGDASPTLNNHLYSALMMKLKGPAADYAASRRDLQGDAISLLNALKSSYRTILTPSELIAVTTKFNNFTRPRDMPIETYVMKMEMMHQDIIDNGGLSSKELLKQNFILGLGPEFTTIINHQNMGTLPSEWQPQDLHTIIPIAKKYLQSILSTRQRNKVYKETHKSPVAPNPSQPTTPSSSRKSNKPPQYSEETKERMKRIYTDIYHNRFKISDYTHR